MVDDQGCGSFADSRDLRELHLLRRLARQRGSDIDVIECQRSLFEFRSDFEDDPILVGLRKYGGDQALSKSVVQRVVDSCGIDAEPARGASVDVNVGLQTLVLQ